MNSVAWLLSVSLFQYAVYFHSYCAVRISLCSLLCLWTVSYDTAADAREWEEKEEKGSATLCELFSLRKTDTTGCDPFIRRSLVRSSHTFPSNTKYSSSSSQGVSFNSTWLLLSSWLVLLNHRGVVTNYFRLNDEMDGPAFLSNVSLIFNKNFQEQQLKQLQTSLTSDKNNVLATILCERLKSSFGLRSMPDQDDVLPFIHFDESGQTHFSLIYTSSLLSPFALICNHYFGQTFMNLQRDVYNLLLANTLNISGTDESDDEETGNKNNQSSPPVLCFANGKSRNETVVAIEKEATDESSNDSLRSYSVGRLLSPGLQITGIDSSETQSQQLRESSESRKDSIQRQEKSRTRVGVKYVKSQLGVKKYRCDSCSKSFSVRSHLESHRVTHTGEKKYECKICLHRFTQSSSLRNHTIAIHTRQFPHICKLCQKGFLLPSQLKKHADGLHGKHSVA